MNRAALGPGTDVLEIGAGTGQATARMLDLGASVTVVELGAEFAAFLESKFDGATASASSRGAFEEVDVEPESFDIVAAATSFHWVPLPVGLQRAADILRPGGSLALWWNVFGDLSRPDPFHEALVPVLERHAPELVERAVSGQPGHRRAPVRDRRRGENRRDRRVATLRAGAPRARAVDGPAHTRGGASALRLVLAVARPSPDRRSEVLDALEDLARDQFNGVVERPYLTTIYVASRLP